MTAPDFEAAGLLDGLEGDARAARRELLERLHAEGASLEELEQAVREQRLVLLPAERILAREGKYTATDVARLSGVDAKTFLAQRRAAGLPIPAPRERAFTEEDVEAARRLKVALDLGLPRDKLLDGARIFGRAAAQAAAASRVLVGEAFLKPGISEQELALRYARAARDLYPQTVHTLEYLYGAHLADQLRNDVIAAADLVQGRLAGTREVAVCFADLVGFTSLGETVAPEDLGDVASRFDSLAAEVTREPVSLIKTIGDAAMLVSPEPEPLVDTALKLVETVSERDDLPELKAGLAMGEALNRFGDWYGTPVNVASRVAAIALPSSVLATNEVHDRVADRFEWSYAGKHRLKGISDDVELFRCRRERPNFRRRMRRRRPRQ